MSNTITLLGKNKLVQEAKLYSYMYKSLKWNIKLKKEIDVNYLKENTVNKELLYHPMWIAKILLIAERKPFPAKKIPNMIFVDAVSGYRGLFSSVPEMVTDNVYDSKLVNARINNSENVKEYITDVQKKQINRSYVLKKPDYQLKDLFLVYLPLWRVKVEASSLQKEFVINGNTGESEEHMSNLWKSGKWLELG